MALVLVAAVFLLTTAGVYLLFERRVYSTVIAVGLLGHAANLIVLAAGRIRSAPPLIPEDGVAPPGVADPLPQALVLTAIVISMAITLYLFALMAANARQSGELDVSAPPAGDQGRDPQELADELAPPPGATP